MANISVIGNDLTIYHAFASLANAAPGATNFNYHRAYIKDYSMSSYMQALNDVFAGTTDKVLGDLMVANLGLSAVVSSSEAEAYLAAAPDRIAAVLDLTKILVNYSGTEAAILSAQTAFSNKMGFAVDYTNSNANASNFPSTFPGSTFDLTEGIDTLIGSANADLFNAYLSAGQTLNNNDELQGAAGTDTLFADLTTSAIATTAKTTGIENVKLRAQHQNANSTDNNTAMDTQGSQIDAERMKDVTNWESNNSRADLIIEDIRINDDQITKDITITMRETDPGHVDYGVYFDQNSLRNVSNSTSTINLEVADTRAIVAGKDPLLNSPYTGFTFTATNKAGVSAVYTLRSQAINDAQTYEALAAAFQVAADDLFGPGAVTVTVGASFTANDTQTGVQVTGKTVSISAKGNFAFDTTPTGSGWIADGVVPADSGLHTFFKTAGVTATDLVTSEVVLDYVGRGSTGGDLVIGGLSVGDTSYSKGVQRFEIVVEDDSALQTINSTNNTLQEVTIVNGTQSRVTDAYRPIDAAGGYLKVNGLVNDLDLNGDDDSTNVQNEPLPGSVGQHNEYGFSDVKLIDASAMTGKLEFTAEITTASIGKYLTLADFDNSPTADNDAFVYSGGSNNDIMTVKIDSAVAASNTLTGQSDFTFAFNGGAGNDAITLDIGGNETAAWYVDQKQNANVTIDGGAGDDTIKTNSSGDVVITAGDGADTVYVDLDKATIGAKWVVNAAAPYALDDLQTNGIIFNGTNSFLYNGKLTVSFSGAGGLGLGGAVTNGDADSVSPYTNGFEVQVDIPTGANYAVSQLYLNQAIKKAINDNAVLNKLVSATDGPANTLVISSKIDGAFDADDISMTVSAAALGTYTTTEQATIKAAYKEFAKKSNATDTDVDTALVAAVTAANGVQGMTTNQILAANGRISSHVADNKINLGAGDDVLVLGTGADSNDLVVLTGYGQGKDTVVNFSDAGSNADALDFKAYLTSKESLSGSTQSQTTIATTLNVDTGVDANSVTVISNAVFTKTNTFADLTDAKLLAAINTSNTGSADYASIKADTLNARTDYINSATDVRLVGGVGKAVVMIENDANQGEYKVFELTFDGIATSNTKADFSAAQLIATVDFGNSLTADVQIFDGSAASMAPAVIPTFELTASAASVNEGVAASFNLVTTGVANGTVLTYVLAGTGITTADTTVALTGTVTVNGNAATLPITPTADLTTEGAETVTMTINGTAATAFMTINDTSLTPGAGIVVAGNNSVAGTAAADLFTFDAVTALVDAGGSNTQASITGFATVAPVDTLKINLPTANAAITTLAQLNGQQGVSVQTDEINIRTVINFGNDAAGGDAVSVTLMGVTDPALVSIIVE